MTKEEIAILKQLSKIGKDIKNLETIVTDPFDMVTEEVTRHIRGLQYIIFSREGMRKYKEAARIDLFNNLDSDTTFKNIMKSLNGKKGHQVKKSEDQPVTRKYTKTKKKKAAKKKPVKKKARKPYTRK